MSKVHGFVAREVAVEKGDAREHVFLVKLEHDGAEVEPFECGVLHHIGVFIVNHVELARLECLLHVALLGDVELAAVELARQGFGCVVLGRLLRLGGFVLGLSHAGNREHGDEHED